MVQLDQLRSGPVDRMSINGGSTLLQYVLVLASHPKQIQCVCSRAFFNPNQIRVKQDNPELSFRCALPTSRHGSTRCPPPPPQAAMTVPRPGGTGSPLPPGSGFRPAAGGRGQGSGQPRPSRPAPPARPAGPGARPAPPPPPQVRGDRDRERGREGERGTAPPRHPPRPPAPPRHPGDGREYLGGVARRVECRDTRGIVVTRERVATWGGVASASGERERAGLAPVGHPHPPPWRTKGSVGPPRRSTFGCCHGWASRGGGEGSGGSPRPRLRLLPSS